MTMTPMRCSELAGMVASRFRANPHGLLSAHANSRRSVPPDLRLRSPALGSCAPALAVLRLVALMLKSALAFARSGLPGDRHRFCKFLMISVYLRLFAV